MSGDRTSFDSYVPRVASEWDMHSPGSMWRSVDGSLLFVDISGFTNLSERLARKGRIGAEELTSVLNRVFGRMLDIVYGRGGSLLKFGGDALLLLFETPDHVMQATASAVEMRAALREASKQRTSVGRIDLKMSSGIHTGPVDFFLVGDSHRELIVTGPTASVTTEMEAAADAGEIVVSDAVRDELPNGFVKEKEGAGWLLRKQRIHLPQCGPVEREPLSTGEMARFISRGLREHLAAGLGEPEHRISTICFVKFKGVDRLLEDEGPERVGIALNQLVSSVQEAADEQKVTFLASDIDADGGKLILSAGVPISRDDDEGRMLRFARSTLDHDLELSIRIGVNRGHVFSGDVGNEFRHTYTVMGDSVNLAARLMAAASPGELYASPAVLDRSSTLFRTEALEPFQVKGKEEPVQAYAVHEETGIRPPELKQDLPFHGRDAELEMLVEIVTTCARSGRGGMMTITGDTGYGKTRLITEVLDECPGLDTLMIQAEPNGVDNPFWAFRDPLRRMLDIKRERQPAMVDSLCTAIAERAPDLSHSVPLLGDLMHIEVPDNEETAAIDPRFRAARAADALVELLGTLYEKPLAVIAEDGHWMDDASVGILELLGAAASSRPWTVILTARRERSDFEPLGDEIPLRPLDEEAVRAIVIEATAAAPLRPHELEAVVARAGGNPLFLSEIIGMIRDTGSANNLPESLDAVVSTEIDTLPPLTRQLLRYSSVLGRSFRRVVLNEFLAPDEIELDEATRKELTRFLEDDGETRIRFRHSVVHDVAYEGLSYRRRRQLHERAGDVIERLAGRDPEAVAEFLADHYSVAGLWEKAWHYSRIAAEKASRAYANTEAAAHYQRALEAGKHLSSDPSEIADIWTQLGVVRELAGQMEAAREAFSRAVGLDREDSYREADVNLRRAGTWMSSGDLSQAMRFVTLGRKTILSEDSLKHTKLLARLDAFESSIYMLKNEPRKAARSARRAADEARSSGEEEALARAYQVLDWANFMLGNDSPRRGQEAIEIYQRLGLLERSVGVINNMGAFAYLEGRWDEAIEWYQESLDSAERSGNVLETALSRANIAEVLIGQGKFEEAMPMLEEARRIYHASNSDYYLPLVGLFEARAKLGLGEVEEALGQLSSLLDEASRSGQTSWSMETEVAYAETLARGGQAKAAIDRLRKFASDESDQASLIAPDVFRIRALALRSLGHEDASIEALKLALEAATDQQSLYEEALVLDELTQARRRAGQKPDPASLDRLSELRHQLGIVSLQPA